MRLGHLVLVILLGAVLAAAVGLLHVAGLLGGKDPGPARRPYDFSLRPIRPAPDDAPSVILLSIDSLRADHLHCYGYERETSPHIDRIAREGALFEAAFASTSWTLPSYMSVFTSLYDSLHGVVTHRKRYVIDHPLLAEVLQAAGYTTAGFYSGPLLHAGYGFSLGFDDYINCTNYPEAGDQTLKEFRRTRRRRGRIEHEDVTNPRIHEAVSRWLEGRAEEPFFLFIHYWDPHYDYIPHAPYDARFDPEYTGDLDVRDFAHNEAIHADMPPRDLQFLIAQYDGEILWTDSWIGRLMDLLREKGVLENALVIITADHGEEFFEHGGKGHGETLFDEAIRVPLVLWMPGKIRAGIRPAAQVRAIDIYPTILEIAGIDPVPGLMGRSLLPFLAEGEGDPDPPPAYTELSASRERGALRSLRTPEWKAIQNLESGEITYFDLAADPGEQVPIPAETDPRGREAIAILQDHVEAMAALGKILRRTGADATFEPDAATMERLRSLGYVK